MKTVVTMSLAENRRGSVEITHHLSAQSLSKTIKGKSIMSIRCTALFGQGPKTRTIKLRRRPGWLLEEKGARSGTNREV